MNIETIKQANINHDRHEANDVLCTLLQSEEITCYKVFERLCSSYIAGSDDFRKGMDKTLQEIIGINLEELSYKVMGGEAV